MAVGQTRFRFSQADTRGVTFVVAAADSTTLSRTKADYTCPGSDDQDTINTAIANLPAIGGSILLMEGTYVIDDPIELPDNVELSGQGRSTIIQVTDGATAFRYGVIQSQNAAAQNEGHTNLVIRDLTIDGNRANQNPARTHVGIYLFWCTDSLIENVYIHDTMGDGIFLIGQGGISEHIIITNNHIEDTEVGGIALSSVSNCIISNNEVINVEGEAVLLTYVGADDCSYNVISNNYFDGFDNNDSGDAGIWVDLRSHFCIIEGNIIKGSGSDQTSSYGIEIIGGASHNIIRGNVIRDVAYGIDLTGSAVGGNLITGNQVYMTGYDGIIISSGENAIIGNYVEAAGQLADNTYSCILISGASADNNNVQSNTCRKGTETNQPKYGLNIDAAPVENTLATNNDLLDSGDTGAFNNAGTGTITAAGNRVA